MASAAPINLPLFYKNLQPLSSQAHAGYKSRLIEGAPFVSGVHAVPLTVDEFISAQRFYPIIFSVGEPSVPLALMGLNEGVNVFFDDAGKPLQDLYVPAYIRRYPFLLARLRPEAEELSLCFDADSGLVGEFDEGMGLFEDGAATDTTKQVLKFCEEFEIAGQRTANFLKELGDHDLLMDGEVTIQPTEGQPFIYRGFKMVSEEKFRELRGDVLRKMNQSGMLAVIEAHLFSLQLMREIFGRQMAQGKVSPQNAQPAARAGQPVSA